MCARSRIAIPVPTSFDPAYNAQSWPEYAAAVERSGGQPVRVELGRTIPQGLDGILLPGSGADMDPGRYGHDAQPETAPPDPVRQDTDTELLFLAEREGLPLLAICFGLQSLNVHRGGTLVQHLAPLPVNHRAGRPVLDAHGATIQTDSRLGALAREAGSTACVMLNSSHHQAVGALGKGLRVVARSSEDNVVEAVEGTSNPWLLGVQWHPERTFDHSRLSQAIFADFLNATREKS